MDLSGAQGELPLPMHAAASPYLGLHHDHHHHLLGVGAHPRGHGHHHHHLLVAALPPPTRMVMPLSAMHTSESDDAAARPGGGAAARKRFRTKFTAEQKARMLGFAEEVGWRLQKLEDAVVQRFCQEVGVKRRVLKVWMHNNKHTLARRHLHPSPAAAAGDDDDDGAPPPHPDPGGASSPPPPHHLRLQ
ncbi:hypothetical protein EE612_058407 [Oryza sativa]|nr:hypothetical protein EE612_058407 [Oryza sativa]